MKSLLFLLLATCSGLTAQARIGEVPEQIDARYGLPLKQHGVVSPDGVFYPMKDSHSEVREKNGVYVSVEFIGGKCAWIMFVKKAVKPKSETGFSANEVALLMTVNADEAAPLRFKESIVSGDDHVWLSTSADGKLFSRATTPDKGLHFRCLAIYTDAWDAKVKTEDAASEGKHMKEQKEQADKALAGF